MATSSQTAVDWQGLLEQVGREGSDALVRLLDSWCAMSGAEAAALYLDDGSLAADRGRKFAHLLDDETDCRGRLDLQGSTLLFDPCLAGGDAGPPEVGPLEVLLSQGAEISHLKNLMRQNSFDDSYRRVELENLYEVGLAIASTLDPDELADGILLRAVSLCDARHGALYVRNDNGFRLQGTFGGDAPEHFDADDPVIKNVLSDSITSDMKILPDVSHLLAVPIEIEGNLRGLLAVADKESRQGVGPFADADRRTLRLFANQAAIALENARLHQEALEKQRLEREMELAGEIQQRILPKDVPVLPGYEVAGWNCPTWQVGGDYYDFMPLRDGHLGLLVADVVGKGMAAALLVSTLHSALRLLLDGDSHAASPMFAVLNDHIHDSSTANKFITLILVELNPRDGSLHFINAGHNPGVIVRSDGTTEELPPGGMPLGLLSGSTYEDRALHMEPGDLLCLYSDGITEAEAPSEEEFGMQRLKDLLRGACNEPISDIMRQIEVSTRDFAAGQPQADDQTVVLLRRDA